LSKWSLGWGSGEHRTNEVLLGVNLVLPSGEAEVDVVHQESSVTLGIASWLFAIGICLVRSIAAGISFSLFWCVASAIYLLLRYDVDRTEMDEVFLPEEDYGESLPDLPKDEAGVPGAPEATTEPAAEAPEESQPSLPGSVESPSDESAENSDAEEPPKDE
jgi:hypothetical protein